MTECPKFKFVQFIRFFQFSDFNMIFRALILEIKKKIAAILFRKDENSEMTFLSQINLFLHDDDEFTSFLLFFFSFLFLHDFVPYLSCRFI